MMRQVQLLLTIPLAAVWLGGCQSNPATSTTQSPSKLMEMKVASVVDQVLSRDYELPGELLAFQDVALNPRIEGFVKTIAVDRGSIVQRGQALLTISAPEMEAKVEEAKSKVQAQCSALLQVQSKLSSARAAVAEGQAKLDTDEATFKRLQKAAATPGTVAENDLDVGAKQIVADKAHMNALIQSVEAAKSLVASEESNLAAARHQLEAVKATAAYMTVTAPFNGVITQRNVHEGSLVDPKMKTPMLQLEQLSRLRLVVPLPEVAAADIRVGNAVEFTVPAYPGKRFSAVIARLGRSLEQHTRTMPVELDVDNTDGRLAPGMYPEVDWHVQRPYETHFVPATAVATSTERTFVIRVNNGSTQIVPVKKGQPMGDFIEVFGDLHAGDQVALRATDDVKNGTHVKTQLASSTDLKRKESAGGE